MEFPLYNTFGVACRDHFGTATPTISHGFPQNPREKPQNLSVTSTKLCLKWAFRVLKSQKFPRRAPNRWWALAGTARKRAARRASAAGSPPEYIRGAGIQSGISHLVPEIILFVHYTIILSEVVPGICQALVPRCEERGRLSLRCGQASGPTAGSRLVSRDKRPDRG